MILEQRAYTQRELAQWFGKTPQTISTNKAKYFDILSYYADFHLEGKKIVVDRVFEEVYVQESRLLQRMKMIDREGGILGYLPESGYSTLTDMAKEYMRRHEGEQKIEPIIRAFSKVAARDFGKYPKGKGPKGLRYTCWVKDFGEGRYEPLSAAERKVVSAIYDKHFSKTVKCSEIAGYIDGEITATQYAEGDKLRYLNFITEASDRLHVKIKTVSKFEASAFEDTSMKEAI